MRFFFIVSFPPNFYKNIIPSNSDLSKNFLLLLKDKITLDFMEFLQIFIKFRVKPGFNLSYAAKMHDCQGENAAKIHDLLEKLAVLVKKSLDL